MRSKNIFAVLLTLIIFSTLPLSWCIAGANRSEENYKIVNDFIFEGWGFKIGKSLRDLRGLGNVMRELISIVDNRHVENQKDEIRELFFDGLYIRAYFPAKDHRFGLLEVVEITKPTFKIKHGLNVGVSISKVTSILGDPDEVENNVYMYHDDPTLKTSTVYFYIEKGMVNNVTWEFILD